MNEKKLTEEELNTIKNLSNNFNEVFLNIGILQVQIAELELKREGAYSSISELRNLEKEIFEKLKEKYGEGVIDLNTGEFKSEK